MKAPPRELTAWRNALLVIFALIGVATASWVSRLAAIRDALHASTFTMGMLALTMAAASVLGTVASAGLSARFGSRGLIRVTLAATGLGLGLIGVAVAAGSAAAIVAAYVVFGFSMGICDVAMNVDGARNEARLGRSVVPLLHAAFSAGTIAGAALGAGAEYLHVPVTAHFLAAAAVMIAGAVIAARYLPQVETQGAKPAGGRLRALARSRRMLLIALFVLSMTLSEGAAADWLGLAMVDGHHTSKAAGALTFTVFVTAMLAGRLGGAYVLDRFPRVLVLRSSAAIAAAGLTVVIVSPFAWLAAVGAAFWGLGTAVGFPAGVSAAAEEPANAAASVSAVATMGYIAFLAGPPLIGTIGEHTGLLPALTAVLVILLAGWVAARAARPPVPPP